MARERVNVDDVPESQHSLFMRGFDGKTNLDTIRDFFTKEGGKCSFDFFKQSDDRQDLSVALRFASKEIARRMLEKFDGSEVLGSRLNISYYKDVRRFAALSNHGGSFLNQRENVAARNCFAQIAPEPRRRFGSAGRQRGGDRRRRGGSPRASRSRSRSGSPAGRSRSGSRDSRGSSPKPAKRTKRNSLSGGSRSPEHSSFVRKVLNVPAVITEKDLASFHAARQQQQSDAPPKTSESLSANHKGPRTPPSSSAGQLSPSRIPIPPGPGTLPMPGDIPLPPDPRGQEQQSDMLVVETVVGSPTEAASHLTQNGDVRLAKLRFESMKKSLVAAKSSHVTKATGVKEAFETEKPANVAEKRRLPFPTLAEKQSEVSRRSTDSNSLGPFSSSTSVAAAITTTKPRHESSSSANSVSANKTPDASKTAPGFSGDKFKPLFADSKDAKPDPKATSSPAVKSEVSSEAPQKPSSQESSSKSKTSTSNLLNSESRSSERSSEKSSSKRCKHHHAERSKSPAAPSSSADAILKGSTSKDAAAVNFVKRSTSKEAAAGSSASIEQAATISTLRPEASAAHLTNGDVHAKTVGAAQLTGLELVAQQDFNAMQASFVADAMTGSSSLLDLERREHKKRRKHEKHAGSDALASGAASSQVAATIPLRLSDKVLSLLPGPEGGGRLVGLSPAQQELLQEKRKELEQGYRSDCETFLQVVKMLISKEPSLEEKLLASFRECLKDIGQKYMQELVGFVDKMRSDSQK